MTIRRLRPGDVPVPDTLVVDRELIGSSPPIVPLAKHRARQINRSAIRRQLHSAPKLAHDTVIDVIFDESWSVCGGNDVIGQRHELMLIALEHLGGGVQGRGRWFARISAFDSPSVFDLSIIKLHRRGLLAAQDVLLRASPGGCSILGPSLRRAEESAALRGARHRLLVVASDFELFDSDPTSTLKSLITSSATEVLAISLNNEPPSLLSGTRVRTARVLSSDAPGDLANHVIDAARTCAATH